MTLRQHEADGALRPVVRGGRPSRKRHVANDGLVRAILDSLPAPTVVIARDGTITDTSRAWDANGACAGGDSTTWSVGANYLLVCERAAASGDADAEQVLSGLRSIVDGTVTSLSYDYDCSSPGSVRWFSLHAIPLKDRGGIVLSHTDITARVEVQDLLAQRLLQDDLTGLPNRAGLIKALDTALAGRFTGEQVAVLLVDLDGFRHVNGSLGHDIGDIVLCAVADRFTALDGAEVVGRLGGDEFVLALRSGATDVATQLADRVRAALAEPLMVASRQLNVTASVGIVLSGAEQARTSDLLRESEIAMYRAKAEGRDRSHVFSAALGTAAHGRLDLASALGDAVTHRQLVLHYQPILRLSDGRVREVEALLRWNHPYRGQLAPAAFIGLAEATRLIVPMTRWVLTEGLRQVRDWSRQGVHLSVAVNITAQHLSLGTLVRDVRGALEATGTAPHQLVLELTETDVARDVSGAAAQLEGLRAMGVRVAIDDFGSGYSSLGQLSTVPADVIKIDRALVQRLGSGCRVDDAIVAAVTSIASTLGITTIAEGIETPAQQLAAATLGCTHAQGFLLGRPVPAGEIPGFMANSCRGREDVGPPT